MHSIDHKRKVEFMNKKKILILGPYLYMPGGVSNYINHLLNNLQDNNVKYIPTGQRKFIYKYLFIIYWIKDIYYLIKNIKSLQPDIIQLNISVHYKSLMRDFIFSLIILKLKIKYVIFIHGWNSVIYNFIIKNFFLKKIIFNFFDSSNKIIVLAAILKKQLINLGILESKIIISTIIINYKKYQYILNNFQKRNINVLFLSNLNKDKGLYELINAIPFVTRSISNVKFIISGDGMEYANVKKIVSRLGLFNYINMTGNVDGVKKYMTFNEADIFVFPTSHGEGFPTVMAEAMASGLPIIATKVGAIPEVIEDGVNGLLLSKPDPQEIAEKIIYLLERPELMKRMGDINREKAKAYDVKVVTQKIISIYNEVLSAKS